MSLYNSGFLGEHFNWWIGQIADDSTWRDNIIPGKFENSGTIPGWGYRYKVRIIGLHDQDEESLNSEQLPWAQVMYPITAGGGQTSSSQTPNIRQGMFVFGFFLDGQDQQVPVIMGVLGNNAQTTLSMQTSLTGGKNFTGQSGYANTKEPKPVVAKERVPDYSLVTSKPTSKEQDIECAAVPPGVKLDKYGLRPDVARNSAQQRDLQDAIAEAEKLGYKKGSPEYEDLKLKRVSEGIKSRCGAALSPDTPPQPGATQEHSDNPHHLSAGDVIREEKYQEKIPLMKPDNKVQSAMKSIQTVLDNLAQKIDKYFHAAESYIDAVSSKIRDIRAIISNAACEIAKYVKVVFDKIMEYILKVINKELTKTVSALPSSMRGMFGDIKEQITELILCLYNKITNGLCGVIQGLLNDLLDIGGDLNDSGPKKQISNKNKNCRVTKPKVKICSAEGIVGKALSKKKDELSEATDKILNNINTFVGDMESQLAGVPGSSSFKIPGIGNITKSLSSALNFENIKLNIFGCELKPNIAVSDFYTFAKGSGGQPDPELPSTEAIAEEAAKDPSGSDGPPEKPFVEPTKATPNNILNSDARTNIAPIPIA
jgi:hypothetical protein